MAEPKKAAAPSDDAKARFKAALDAKNARARQASTGEGGEAGAGGTKGPQQAGSGPKMFRRKAGG